MQSFKSRFGIPPKRLFYACKLFDAAYIAEVVINDVYKRAYREVIGRLIRYLNL